MRTPIVLLLAIAACGGSTTEEPAGTGCAVWGGICTLADDPGCATYAPHAMDDCDVATPQATVGAVCCVLSPAIARERYAEQHPDAGND